MCVEFTSKRAPQKKREVARNQLMGEYHGKPEAGGAHQGCAHAFDNHIVAKFGVWQLSQKCTNRKAHLLQDDVNILRSRRAAVSDRHPVCGLWGFRQLKGITEVNAEPLALLGCHKD